MWRSGGYQTSALDEGSVIIANRSAIREIQ